ncbi:hypothetical protein AMECASPLE_038725, partial [Ameca splendens]
SKLCSKPCLYNPEWSGFPGLKEGQRDRITVDTAVTCSLVSPKEQATETGVLTVFCLLWLFKPNRRAVSFSGTHLLSKSESVAPGSRPCQSSSLKRNLFFHLAHLEHWSAPAGSARLTPRGLYPSLPPGGSIAS